MAYLLKTDGTIVEVHPANGERFTLEEMQKLVGGYLEHTSNFQRGLLAITDKAGTKTLYELNVGQNADMFFNEDGKRLELPFNPIASMLYDYGRVDPLVGDVLIAHTERGLTKDGEPEDWQF